jgi:ribosomal protein S18 acetylase RimI-like enzyme
MKANMTQPLDNVFWHALSNDLAHCAVGTSEARRFAPGFSPIIAFADPDHPGFDALEAFCDIGEHFYTDGWTGTAPEGWQIDAEKTMVKMVFDRPPPTTDEAPEAIRIAPEHLDQVLALAHLTQPGPFGPRTVELGEYFGLFEGKRLVAMAGERAHAGRLREVSGVCTHPDAQGRGMAKRLMHKLIRRQMQRGETPFLHVMSDNTGALPMYQRMGFEAYRTVVVRVISRR